VVESVSSMFMERCKGSSAVVSRNANERPWASAVQMLRKRGDNFSIRFMVDFTEDTRMIVGLLRAVMGGRACTVGA
jgi:hypothetical protein